MKLRIDRRGSALILVLLMTLAVAALAIAAIFMTSSAGLLSRFYDKERLYSNAAQSALEQVIAQLKADTSFRVTSTTPTLIVNQAALEDAQGATLSGVTVSVWGAVTGDTTRTGPITITLLARVSDATGTRWARRADLRRESFAYYNLLLNSSTTSSTRPFASSAVVSGRIHVNGSWVALAGSPTYRDTISATGTIGGGSNDFLSVADSGARIIPWPGTNETLSADSVAAAAAGLVIAPSGSLPMRLEFRWVDDGDGSVELGEGYVRVFDLASGNSTNRMDVNPYNHGGGSSAWTQWDSLAVQNQCGAFYYRSSRWHFIPVSTHKTSWAQTLLATSGTPSAPTGLDWTTSDNTRRDATRAVLSVSTARCFPAGSPYLVNTERFTDNSGNVGTGSSHRYPYGIRNASHRYGGSDTTYTASPRTCTLNDAGTNCSATPTSLGSWRTAVALSGAQSGAVVFGTSNLRVSGQIVGRVKLAVRGTATIVDRIQLAAGPNVEDSSCDHFFGLVARDSVRVADNLINRRSRVGSSAGSSSYTTLGGVSHFTMHGAFLSLERTVGVNGNDTRTGGSGTIACEGTNYSGGCLNLVGSFAMNTPRAPSTGTNLGFRLMPMTDACFAKGYRPPLYPATNRYRLLRVVEVRARELIGLTAVEDYFASLQGISDIP